MKIARFFSVGIAVVILLGSGVMYHSLARDSEQLEVAVSRMPRVPLEVGDWRAQQVPETEDDQRAFERAGARGYWMRTYVHQRTKVSVLVILMCGRAGKMAVHTPEVCYGGAGYDLREAPAICPVKNQLGEETSQLWTSQFTKQAGKSNLRLYWGWTVNGMWEASPNPRWQYRGEPYLYKLYVSRDLGPLSPSAQNDPSLDLLRQLLPELDAILFT